MECNSWRVALLTLLFLLLQTILGERPWLQPQLPIVLEAQRNITNAPISNFEKATSSRFNNSCSKTSRRRFRLSSTLISISTNVIQRAALGIIEEAKDEFPNLTSLVQSQKREPVLKRSRNVMSKVMSMHNDEELANGMTNIFKFSRSTPQLLQTQILPKMARLHLSSHQPMIAQAQAKTCLLMEHGYPLNANSFPARTVITNLVYAIIICMATYSKMAVEFLKEFAFISPSQQGKDSSAGN